MIQIGIIGTETWGEGTSEVRVIKGTGHRAAPVYLVQACDPPGSSRWSSSRGLRGLVPRPRQALCCSVRACDGPLSPEEEESGGVGSERVWRPQAGDSRVPPLSLLRVRGCPLGPGSGAGCEASRVEPFALLPEGRPGVALLTDT